VSADGAQQLPRGRHRLSREEVFASQRGRLLAAMARAVAAKGFARTVVADVLAGAGVSRETFYEQFRDKEDCFLAAYEAAVETLLASVTEATAGAEDADPIERFDRAIAAYLELMAQDEALARVFLIDVYAAGAPALERRLDVFERFVDLVAEIFGARTRQERLRAEALVGALSSMVTMRVAAKKTAELPMLRNAVLAVARSLWTEA
jgi:AcrR family transcriptional regulator